MRGSDVPNGLKLIKSQPTESREKRVSHLIFFVKKLQPHYCPNKGTRVGSEVAAIGTKGEGGESCTPGGRKRGMRGQFSRTGSRNGSHFLRCDLRSFGELAGR